MSAFLKIGALNVRLDTITAYKLQTWGDGTKTTLVFVEAWRSDTFSVEGDHIAAIDAALKEHHEHEQKADRSGVRPKSPSVE